MSTHAELDGAIDDVEDEELIVENEYSVSYTENPVMYLGVSYGTKPVKGIQFGIDLGVLSTGGASVTHTGHMHLHDDDEEHNEMHEERIEDAIDEITDNFAWTMLPNIQIGVSYGF